MKIELPSALTASWNWIASTEDQSYVTVYFGGAEIVTIPAVREVELYSYTPDDQRKKIIDETVATWLKEKLIG